MHSYMHAPIQDDERLLFKTATVRSGLLCGLGRMLADHAKTHTLPTRPSRGDCCLVCVCVCPSLCMHARVMMRARSRPTTPGWSGAFQLTNTEAEAGRQAGLCVHAWKAHTHAHTHTHTHTHTGLCQMEGYEDAPIFKNRGMREREGPEISPCRRDRENGDTASDRCRLSIEFSTLSHPHVSSHPSISAPQTHRADVTPAPRKNRSSSVSWRLCLCVVRSGHINMSVCASNAHILPFAPLPVSACVVSLPWKCLCIPGRL
jgi:hypothetical protein